MDRYRKRMYRLIMGVGETTHRSKDNCVDVNDASGANALSDAVPLTRVFVPKPGRVEKRPAHN